MIQEQVGRSRPAIRNCKICLSQDIEDSIQFALVGKINELRVGMETFQRGILVVGVDGDMAYAFVLQELDEVYREEAFAYPALSVDDQVKAFHGSIAGAFGRLRCADHEREPQ